MLLGAVILAASIIGLFAVPEGFGTNESLIWVTIFSYATLGFTGTIPYGAITGGLPWTKREIFDDRMANGVCLTWYFNRRRLMQYWQETQDPVIHSPRSVWLRL